MVFAARLRAGVEVGDVMVNSYVFIMNDGQGGQEVCFFIRGGQFRSMAAILRRPAPAMPAGRRGGQ
jgi:hypothetical protein